MVDSNDPNGYSTDIVEFRGGFLHFPTVDNITPVRPIYQILSNDKYILIIIKTGFKEAANEHLIWRGNIINGDTQINGLNDKGQALSLKKQ